MIRRQGRKTGKGTLRLPPPIADISYVSESRTEEQKAREEKVDVGP